MKNPKSVSNISPKRLLLVIISIIAFALLFSSVLDLARKHKAIKNQISLLKQEKSSLAIKKENVTNQNSYIDSPEGQEYTIRDKYRLVRPGEGMIIVTSNNPDIPVNTSKQGKIQRFWQSILKGLGL
jgi:uncharacterized membrane protein